MSDTNNQDQNQDTNKGEDNSGQDDKKNEKTFNQEQLDEIVSKRLGAEKAKMEKTIAEKVAEAQAEADRKAKLSEEERRADEAKKASEQLTQKETELALRESSIEAKEQLQSKNISTDLVNFVVDVDMDKTKENVDLLEKAFTKAVEAQVADKLKGKTPDDPANKANGSGDKTPSATGRIAF